MTIDKKICCMSLNEYISGKKHICNKGKINYWHLYTLKRMLVLPLTVTGKRSCNKKDNDPV